MILNSFIEAGILQKEEYTLYYYCLDALLSKAFFIIAILGLALFLDKVSIMIAYYFGFLLIRYTNGGYHANSPISCFILSIGIYLGALGLTDIMSIESHPEILSVTLFCVIFIVWRFAPVDHPNKRFSPEEKLAYRKKGRITVVCCVILAIILWLLNNRLGWAFIIGIAVAALSIVAAVKKRKEGIKYVKKFV